MTLCACGCQQPVPRRQGRQRKFLSRAHYAQALMGPAYAEFRRRRALAASAAGVQVRRQQAMARASRFRTKAEAYAVGLRTGHNAAYRYWRAKYLRALKGRAA